MRTLSDTLLAAQKKPDRLPYVEAKIYDFEQGIKRLSWTRLYQGTEPDYHHGIAFDGQGSMHRIRAEGNNLYYQKIKDPYAGVLPSFPLSFPIPLLFAYSDWQPVTGDCFGPCAIAACGAKIYIFYRNTSNVLRKYYSHDYGLNWTSDSFVAYADVLSLAACWWATGNIVVCFALKSNEINGIVLDSSSQTTSQHIKTFHEPSDVHQLLDTYGIGATYDPFIPGCAIVFAAKESDMPYNHYDLWRTQFSSTYHFLALESFLMAPVGEDATYEYPDCHLPASPQDYESTRIIAVEKFTGTTAYTRPLACHLVKGGHFSDAIFTEPKPFLNISSDYGLRIMTSVDYWWMERPDGVWRAPRAVGDPLDLTKDILSLTQRTQQTQPTLLIELDNHDGKYANPGEGDLAALKRRSEVVLKLGYKTSAGNEASKAGTYWVDGWEWTHDSGLSTFRLSCLDGWGLADKWSARYQMRWNKDQVGPKSVWQILYLILCRFGIRLTNSPPKPQSSAINNFYPDFIIQPGTGGDTAIRRLLSFAPDLLVFRGQETFTKNLLADEGSCYSYGTDHVILAGEYRQLTHASRARAIGRDDTGSRIVEDTIDWDLLQLAIDILEQDYDPNLENATRTQERADAILRTAAQQALAAQITVPTNCGQEFLDVITVTDERCGISNKKYRVIGIETSYGRQRGSYIQRLSLAAP